MRKGGLNQKKNFQIVAATVGAEFAPEATPFIPDSNHKILTQHKNATIERIAGYQDASLVPPMYKSQVDEKKRIEKELSEQPIDILPMNEEPVQKKPDPEMPLCAVDEFETDIDSIVSSVEMIVCKPVEKKPVVDTQKAPSRGRDAEFTMKVSREKMHAGGTYMPNEYRPFRPGS